MLSFLPKQQWTWRKKKFATVHALVLCNLWGLRLSISPLDLFIWFRSLLFVTSTNYLQIVSRQCLRRQRWVWSWLSLTWWWWWWSWWEWRGGDITFGRDYQRECQEDFHSVTSFIKAQHSPLNQGANLILQKKCQDLVMIYLYFLGQCTNF